MTYIPSRIDKVSGDRVGSIWLSIYKQHIVIMSLDYILDYEDIWRCETGYCG